MVNKCPDVVIDGGCVKNRGSDIDNVRQVLCKDGFCTEDFPGNGIHEFVNLINSHFNILFSIK